MEHRADFTKLWAALGEAYKAAKNLRMVAPGLGTKIIGELWRRGSNMDLEVSRGEATEQGLEAVSILFGDEPVGRIGRVLKVVKNLSKFVAGKRAANVGKITAEMLRRVGVDGECIPEVVGLTSEPAVYDPRVDKYMTTMCLELTKALDAIQAIRGKKEEKPGPDLRARMSGGVLPVIAGQRLNLLRH